MGSGFLDAFCWWDGFVCFGVTFASVVGFVAYLFGTELSMPALVLLGNLIYVTATVILTKSK